MKKTIKFRKKKYSANRTKKLNKENFTQLSNEKYKILFLILSITGIIIGAISFRLVSNTQFNQIIINDINTLNSGSIKNILLYFLYSELLYFIISFFIGTSFIGSNISFISPMLKCIYIGYLSGYLYNNFELRGVLFALILYPCFSITTTSLIYACNENVYMSKYILNVLNGKNNLDNISIKLFILRYALLIIINVACIIATAAIISFFAPKINLT